MELQHHGLPELFAQLGLPADDRARQAFIHSHAPLADEIALEDAPFWSPGQADLLREKLLEDADWAIAIDRLDVALRLR
jgi:hypothetical protein